MVEVMVIASMFESIASWFTPTVLFCVTNLIIATVFIASNKHHDHNNHVHEHSNSLTPIARVSSFLDRASSMNLSSYTVAESHHQSPPQSKTASNYSSSSRLAQSIHFPSGYVNSVSKPARVPSLFERVKSIKFTESNQFMDLPDELVRVPSLYERVKSIKFSSGYNENAFPVDSDVITNSPGELSRVPSFFDRVKSFKIVSAFKTTPVSTQMGNVDPDPGQNNPDHHVIRSKSENLLAKKKSLLEMKKSRSEANMAPGDDDEEDVDIRRPATTRERRDEFDEEVDAKADDFISRFKQQLKLQRLESLVRYNDMLNRRSWK